MRFAKMANAVFGLAINRRKLLCYACKAGVAQLVEHELPKLGVAGSNPVARSMHSLDFSGYFGVVLAADAMAKIVFHNSNKRTVSMTGPVIFKSHQCQSKSIKAKPIFGVLVAKVPNSLFAMAAITSFKKLPPT